MTHHYWVEFAGSLQDLGLSSGSQFQATVIRDAVRTRLWLKPYHGTEVYLAEVESSGVRLQKRHCPGDRDGAGQVAAGHCPEGWQRIQLN